MGRRHPQRARGVDGRRGVVAVAFVCVAALSTATAGAAARSSETQRPGTLREFEVPTAQSEPAAITTGPDGALWFTEVEAHKVGRISTTGRRIKEYDVPSAGAFFYADIVAGPDGNVWFAAGNSIGRITPHGSRTAFSLGKGFASRITVAPDGNLWFLESFSSRGSRVGRITPTGDIKVYKPPSAGYGLTALTTGPDGNLWFTENTNARGPAKIGRITLEPAVHFDEFAIPTRKASAQGIVSGSDGNLWFTENRQSKIGRITTAGVITEYALPHASSKPSEIAAGSDGNVWFIEQRRALKHGTAIARITPDGVITEFGFPHVTNLRDITSGPDGNLWLADVGGAIGRFVLPAA
jgi:virginiamycin B lyase